ncbi:uncharacterized protein PAC_00288 [Phialocephala subalpina]|uniref:F-box domain-containing protein n=1 Tax=Phialocephala subalpina TaxID=576137 RepID=A0A1L7WCA9_9HELO|nr:uncharacterized protein PAC_00288 [Phialocephala subalpina]
MAHLTICERETRASPFTLDDTAAAKIHKQPAAAAYTLLRSQGVVFEFCCSCQIVLVEVQVLSACRLLWQLAQDLDSRPHPPSSRILLRLHNLSLAGGRMVNVAQDILERVTTPLGGLPNRSKIRTRPSWGISSLIITELPLSSGYYQVARIRITSYLITFSATAMVFLLDLPNELVFDIIKHLDHGRDIKSLARVSREYYGFFNDDVYRHDISSRGGYGVLWAIAHDQASAVGKFLDLGLDMNHIPGCRHYSTLLHLAAQHGSLSTVKLLLQRGADINAKTKRGVTPLFNALKYRHDEIIRAISERITDIGKVFVDFRRALTPLHAACEYKLPNAARLLLELGDDLRAKDADGKSPLHHALSGDRVDSYRGNGGPDAAYDTVMVLLEFGVQLDLVKWELEYSGMKPVSTFQLGINHEDPRVRGLFRETRNKTPVIAHGGLSIGRAWMSPEAREDDAPSTRLSWYQHSSKELDADINFLSTKSSETLISPCSECDKPHLEPWSDRGGEYTELTGNSFPALSNVSPSPVPSTQSTAGIWSPSDVQQLVAKISLTEAKSKIPPTPKARQTDPFPQLVAETPLPHFSIEAKEKWLSFRKPLNEDRVEGSHVMGPNSGDRLDEGRRHKAREILGPFETTPRNKVRTNDGWMARRRGIGALGEGGEDYQIGRRVKILSFLRFPLKTTQPMMQKMMIGMKITFAMRLTIPPIVNREKEVQGEYEMLDE